MRAMLLAVLLWLAFPELSYGLAWLDWDEIMVLAMAVAGLGYILVDSKRERTLESQALSIEHRLTMLEHAGDERIAKLEQAVESLSLTAEVTRLATRIALLEQASVSDDSSE